MVRSSMLVERASDGVVACVETHQPRRIAFRFALRVHCALCYGVLIDEVLPSARAARCTRFFFRKLSSAPNLADQTPPSLQDSSNCSPLPVYTPSSTLKMLKKYVFAVGGLLVMVADAFAAASRALPAPMPFNGPSVRPASDRPSNPRPRSLPSHNASRATNRRLVRARSTR